MVSPVSVKTVSIREGFSLFPIFVTESPLHLNFLQIHRGQGESGEDAVTE